MPTSLDLTEQVPLKCSFKGTLTHVESAALRDAIKKLREERKQHELKEVPPCEGHPQPPDPLPPKYVFFVLGLFAAVLFEMVYLFV